MYWSGDRIKNSVRNIQSSNHWFNIVLSFCIENRSVACLDPDRQRIKSFSVNFFLDYPFVKTLLISCRSRHVKKGVNTKALNHPWQGHAHLHIKGKKQSEHSLLCYAKQPDLLRQQWIIWVHSWESTGVPFKCYFSIVPNQTPDLRLWRHVSKFLLQSSHSDNRSQLRLD